jgi:hypothetical protein
MPPVDGRTQLGALQAELVRALTGQGGPPDGFDAARLQAAANALVRKRVGAVARAWPGLARALGESFGERFTAFAQVSSVPKEGGPLADGRAFARTLQAAGELPDAGRLEAAAVDLRYVTRKGGLVPRRWPALTITRLRSPRRLVLGVRVPRLGEWWLSIPLG